jgi:hypothetical protein
MTPGWSKRGRRSAGRSGSTAAPAGRSTTVSWGCLGLHQPARARADRPRALLARRLDRGPRPLLSRGDPRADRVQDQARAGRAIERLHAAERCGGGFTAAEAFGQNPGLRDWLATRQVPYVLATRNDDLLGCPDGHRVRATSAHHPARLTTCRHTPLPTCSSTVPARGRVRTAASPPAELLLGSPARGRRRPQRCRGSSRRPPQPPAAAAPGSDSAGPARAIRRPRRDGPRRDKARAHGAVQVAPPPGAPRLMPGRDATPMTGSPASVVLSQSLPRTPERPSNPCDDIGSAASSTSICRWHDVDELSAPTGCAPIAEHSRTVELTIISRGSHRSGSASASSS